MRKLIVYESLTLDGVAQAPGGVDEDRSGGFSHGGWHMQYVDEEIGGAWIDKGMSAAGGFVLGRTTYEIFAGYWPNAPAEEGGIAERLNTLPKYVASTTLSEPLAWQNSHLLQGDAAEAVRALTAEPGGDLLTFGSLSLVRTLLANDVVDELRLMFDPVVVGGGKRLFDEDGILRQYRLVDQQVTGTGVILATYAPAR